MRYLERNISVFLFFILNIISLSAFSQNSNEAIGISELILAYDSISHDFIYQDSICQDSTRMDSLALKIPICEYIIFKPTFLGDTVITIEPVEPWVLEQRLDSLVSLPISRTDSLLYGANPLLMPLVYVGKDLHQIWDGELRCREWLYPEKKSLIVIDTTQNLSAEKQVADLRTDARKHIANNAMHLYVTTMDRLPHLSTFMSRPILGKKLQKLDVHDDKIDLGVTRIDYEKVQQVYWQNKSNALIQFSQNYVSPNWHQGGQSNLAFLSTLVAEFNYDNRKNTQWDNKLEWRAGFSSVDGDTLRKVSTNDDVLRYLTKFGLKAGGNWYYSVSGEVSTHLFNNYRKINSDVLKTKLLTPVRANIGIGMDYKYKKIFSLMIAPVTFKYIYMNDTVNVDPNSLGIKKGENQLKQFGSSLLAQFNYSPALNWDITARLRVYSDYKKVESDLEVVNNFTINRFLTARLLINPRYDNTAILKEGEKKATIQLKELLSIGFSYRFF